MASRCCAASRIVPITAASPGTAQCTRCTAAASTRPPGRASSIVAACRCSIERSSSGTVSSTARHTGSRWNTNSSESLPTSPAASASCNGPSSCAGRSPSISARSCGAKL
ncbi:hypothetical protein BBK82_44195 [Lentzea guizhouensis]|uniref:Uncharacterized protein n=1 Tax=Lentzea guizhouensis TaxID=1586287 RepID=A0A1B2HW19_9PSEU|nr:hypothetical protein BBK82_44195 [Lentzea guizhouensis]